MDPTDGAATSAPSQSGRPIVGLAGPTVLQRHRSLRWLVPAAVLAVAGLVTTGILRAGASSETLPPTTPAALLHDVRTTTSSGFSGTVVTQLSLGLPDLPQIGNLGDGSSLTSLLSGSHTLQVWYGGPGKQRIALLGTTDESDIFRNGRDLWQWNSADHIAAYSLLPADAAHGTLLAPTSTGTLTPSGLATRALAALDPTTKVAVGDPITVADRRAYELTMTPRSDTSRIGEVRIAVDGDTKVPLGVQVFPRGSSDPAVDVSFTTIRFATPSDTVFRFTPPPDARINRLDDDGTGSDDTTSAEPAALPTVQVSGSGWSRVVGVSRSSTVARQLDSGPFARVLTPVSGSWGHGRLLDATLFSALFTSDGRTYIGAVDPPALYAAAARTK